MGKDRKSKPKRFVKSFKHYRTGRIIRAEDYGHRAFPIWSKPKRRR